MILILFKEREFNIWIVIVDEVFENCVTEMNEVLILTI